MERIHLNKQLKVKCLAGTCFLAAIALSAGCDKASGTGSDYAEVTAVKAVMTTVDTPRQECVDEVVTLTRETKDPHQIVGTVAGAVIGGVIGNQIGSGKGQDAATVGGAVAGGYAGNQVQEVVQDRNTYQQTRQNCVTVNDSREVQTGYQVTYLINGDERTIQLAYDPGRRIPLNNGELVLRN